MFVGPKSNRAKNPSNKAGRVSCLHDIRTKPVRSLCCIVVIPSSLCPQLRRNGIEFCTDIFSISSGGGAHVTANPKPVEWIALVGTLLLSGVGVTVPTNTARADNCLAAPNSPAPQESHWYYRLDRATQRKCWYVRVVGQPVQQAALPATVGPATLLHSSVVRAKTC